MPTVSAVCGLYARKGQSDMKKAISAAASAFLALALSIPCAPAVRAAAACELTLSPVTVSEHAKSVTVPLNMKSVIDVFSADFVIDLPDNISFLNVTGDDPGVSVRQTEDGDLRVSVRTQSAPLSGEVKLCNLILALPDAKKAGDSFSIGIAVPPGDVLDSGMQGITAQGGTSVIRVEGAVMYGDVNGDSMINARDITTIMKRLTGADIYIDLEAADVNLDGNLNARDITRIMRHMMGVATARLGHRDVTETIVEASCQNEGTARLTCVVCGDSVVVTTPSVPHVYVAGRCTMCGGKHRDYPILAYADYLKANGRSEASLRGFALYDTLNFQDYSLFSSNICDSKTGHLIIFGVGTFKNSLSCSVSIDMSSVESSYGFTYYANLGDRQIAKAEGRISSDLSVSFSDFSGSADSKVRESHLQIAQSIAKNCVAHTDKLMRASGLGVSAADLGFQIK